MAPLLLCGKKLLLCQLVFVKKLLYISREQIIPQYPFEKIYRRIVIVYPPDYYRCLRGFVRVFCATRCANGKTVIQQQRRQESYRDKNSGSFARHFCLDSL